MKIVISSHGFYPNIGGIETVTALLAREWKRLGYAIDIITQTPGADEWEGCRVHRQPDWRTIRKIIMTADFYLQNHFSFRTLWPVLDRASRTTVLHQTYLFPWDQPKRLTYWVKRLVTLPCNNLAISRAIGAQLPRVDFVLGNPYDDAVFRIFPEVARTRDIVFVGRLVSDKGLDILLRALQKLNEVHHESRKVQLTIIGDGPQRGELNSLIQQMDLSGQVRFQGVLEGEALAAQLNSHKILVVPSRWPEPFGIVALEGAACGCYVIGSEQGGLAEAIGPCGVTFPNGDVGALSERIAEGIYGHHSTDPDAIKAHLQKHKVAMFAERLLNLMSRGL